jgi:hypothetical protein
VSEAAFRTAELHGNAGREGVIGLSIDDAVVLAPRLGGDDAGTHDVASVAIVILDRKAFVGAGEQRSQAPAEAPVRTAAARRLLIMFMR